MLADSELPTMLTFLKGFGGFGIAITSMETGAGGEARAPPPQPTPWVDRQGNPGSRGSYPSSQ